MTTSKVPPQGAGLLVIGHGSRRLDANATLGRAAAALAAGGDWLAVEHAFLELAEPDIAEAYGRLVSAGCATVVVSLFFLLPGAHTISDIPAQLTTAAERHPGARWLLTEPLGLHPAVLEAARARIEATYPAR